jgi:hypothetical protein
MLDRYANVSDTRPETLSDLRSVLDGKIGQGIRDQVRLARKMARSKKGPQEQPKEQPE